MKYNKKMLIISLNPYPNYGTGSNLFNHILFDGKMIDKFSNIDLVTYANSYYDNAIENINGIKVFRIITHRMLNKRYLFKTLFKHPIVFVISIFSKIIYIIYNKLISKSCLDHIVVNEVYNKLVEIKADIYDVILVIVCPYEAAISTSSYIKNTKTKLFIWQVDPCSTNISMSKSSFKERLNIEDKIFNAAYRVFSVPQTYIDLSMNTSFFNKFCDKIIKMNLPLITKNNLYHIAQNNYRKNKKIYHCVFMGNIYNGIRDPLYTIRLFDNLDADFAKLYIYGETTEDLSSKNVVFNQKVTILEAHRIMNNADFLVNIGNKMINQVPSKIYEYISFGKPIINICKNRNCPTLSILKKYPYVLNLYEEENIFDEQVNKLYNFIATNVNKHVSFDFIKKAYFECTPEFCAKMMLDEIYK